jgi:hypothetical protein
VHEFSGCCYSHNQRGPAAPTAAGDNTGIGDRSGKQGRRHLNKLFCLCRSPFIPIAEPISACTAGVRANAPAKPDDLLRPRRGHEFDIDDHYGPILGLTGVIAATVMSYLVFICVPILLDAERLLSRLRGQAEAKRSVA